MDSEQLEGLGALVRGRSVAALGTLHDGAPYVSMVPFAVLPDGSAFVVHVSGLSAHTRDMRADPRVSLLIAQPEREDLAPQALARVTVQADAREVRAGAGDLEASRQAYLSRFPGAAQLFSLGDFALFDIVPRSVRYIAGFAQAFTISPETLARALRGA